MSVTRQEVGRRLLETPMTRKQFLVLCGFGVDLKGKKVVDYYWDGNGLGRVVFPSLFVNHEHDISEKLSNKEGLPDRVNG